MSFVQVTVYLDIIVFLCYDLERGQAEKFGVRYISSDYRYKIRNEWADLIDTISARYRELKTLGIDLQSMIDGCCDICETEGDHKSRGEHDGIWEV